MGSFGTTEIIIIIAVLILFFGASKIPDLARGIGEGMSEFKKATRDELDDNKKNEKKEASDSNEVKQPKTE